MTCPLWTKLVDVSMIHASCGQAKRAPCDKHILVIAKFGVPGIKGKQVGSQPYLMGGGAGNWLGATH